MPWLAVLTPPFFPPSTDEVESLKKYSQLIVDLKESGGEGCAGKAADMSTGAARKTVPIKGNPDKKGAAYLEGLSIEPNFSEQRNNGGLED